MTLRELIKEIVFQSNLKVILVEQNPGGLTYTETSLLYDGHSKDIEEVEWLDYSVVFIFGLSSEMHIGVYKDERPLDPLFTNTVTMKNFDYGYAWENRYNIPVEVGTLLLLDGCKKFQIVAITMPAEHMRADRCPWYTLKPVEDTLEEMMREYDEFQRKNCGMATKKYPDFQFDVESNWFFSRDVRW